MKSRIILALIGIIPTCLAAVLGFIEGKKSTQAHRAEVELQDNPITLQFSKNPNYKQLIYPNYGLSLFVPISWTIEDGPALLAGGEFNLVQRYEETKGAIGMNFRLRPVQNNYINDLNAQVNNQVEVLNRNFKNVKLTNRSISGASGHLFEYEMPTGARTMRIKMYWLRLVPTVQLQIQCAQYIDAVDADEFWKNVDQVISNVVVASDSWQARYKSYYGL